MAPSKRRKTDSATMSDEMSEGSSKPRANGVKAAARGSSAAVREKSSRKPSSKKQSSKSDASSKKQKRKDGAPKKRKKPEGGARAAYGTDDDLDDEEDADYYQQERPGMPEIGDEVAIKCPPDPPYPEGWYTGVVIDVILHDEGGSNAPNGKAGPPSDAVNDFTVHVEWDGGGEEQILNPEWRMKTDAPDKHGRVSHRDAKLRPYFKYWVSRLNSMSESEKKLSKNRAGKNLRVDPDQKVEWIQCSNPNCGKWRPIPSYMKSSNILETCKNKWYCVLNSWDEAVASCGAPQETGYMPAK